ncbi:major facilitator superfamily (MFS) transporter [Candidatus Koribacter versatilis Ellin345]|uniref:Major facilitator superfamily (MFS) transporter n=1 Tax=Koribacter versatilis (strain Ellin345) TaxID=204669 RepID=Q1IKY9_KORVE|nr:MFS transporter [Candidatus Koribacter versatilis]ABF42461.1 major facilitator superfamily (MFS) transporter [Candidatus Koribacter versatilis Ellin345]
MASGSRAAFQYPAFRYFQMARFLVVSAMEMQSVAVGWQVYEITRRPLDLGLVGLAQFLPGILLFLLAGHTADRLPRHRIVARCYAAFALCSALLLMFTARGLHNVRPIYVVLVLIGIVRAFNGPAGQSLMPQLVSAEDFPNAAAWGSSIFNTATILGPALGGLLYGITGPKNVYLIATISFVFAFVSALFITVQSAQRPRGTASLRTVLAGFDYLWHNQIVLGAISLDLFAVLLGGAVALLPVYAREILRVGPWGLGILRSAPGVGAVLMALVLAHRPLRKRAGAVMLWCVAIFGVATIVFGLSRSVMLSLITLLTVGASDMVSVIVRSTLVQLNTPDEMRGRVSAVNMLFIGASNEFGQFESGITAQWLGTVPAVVWGGVGTLVVVAVWSVLFPRLRRVDSLTEQPNMLPAEPAVTADPN